nr:unnamed protein product [Digitaria exilis]
MTGGTHGFETGPCILGYITSTGEYKVLRIRTYATCNDGETTFHLKQACDVMTLGDGGGGGTWRAMPCPPVLVSPQSGQSVVVDGVAYFLLSQLDINCDPTKFKPDTIACFDMATEEWRQETLRGPINSDLITAVDKKLMLDLHYNNLELAVLDGCLVMVQHGFRVFSIDLWFLVDMDVDKGLWTKRFSARYAPGFHKNSAFCINVLYTPAMALLESSRHGRKKPSNPAAPLADYGLLPADIMFDVLLRIPAKELCRLRVICRAWSLITHSPLFAKAHSSRHPLVLGLRNRSEVQFIDLSGNTVKKLATGACDLISPLELSSQLDLVCVSEITGRTCVVVNSATGAVTVLPRDIGIEQDINMGATHWHFPLPESTKWRARSPPRALFVSTTSRDRVVVDGVAYFLLEHGIEPDAVASFDMATEEWRPMTLQGPQTISLDEILNGYVTPSYDGILTLYIPTPSSSWVKKRKLLCLPPRTNSGMELSDPAPQHKPDEAVAGDPLIANDGVLPTDVLRGVLLCIPPKPTPHPSQG